MAGNDPHSLARERVNGVVSNTEAWYDLFGVKPGDKLYREPADRVHIWYKRSASPRGAAWQRRRRRFPASQQRISSAYVADVTLGSVTSYIAGGCDTSRPYSSRYNTDRQTGDGEPIHRRLMTKNVYEGRLVVPSGTTLVA